MNKIFKYSVQSPIARLLFAHGAGAGHSSDFICDIAKRLQGKGIEVITFNFDYMQLAVEQGKRRPPPKIEKLVVEFQHLIETIGTDLPLFIGGKSMGGRVATLLEASEKTLGAIVMGYPFHPQNKPDKLRVSHLKNYSAPLLILQGERDTFGSADEVASYALSNAIRVKFITDGDHSLKPRKLSGKTYDNNLEDAVTLAHLFIQSVISKRA